MAGSEYGNMRAWAHETQAAVLHCQRCHDRPCEGCLWNPEPRESHLAISTNPFSDSAKSITDSYLDKIIAIVRQA